MIVWLELELELELELVGGVEGLVQERFVISSLSAGRRVVY